MSRLCSGAMCRRDVHQPFELQLGSTCRAGDGCLIATAPLEVILALPPSVRHLRTSVFWKGISSTWWRLEVFSQGILNRLGYV